MSIILVIDVKLVKEKLLWRRQTTINDVEKHWIISARENSKRKQVLPKNPENALSSNKIN